MQLNGGKGLGREQDAVDILRTKEGKRQGESLTVNLSRTVFGCLPGFCKEIENIKICSNVEDIRKEWKKKHTKLEHEWEGDKWQES